MVNLETCNSEIQTTLNTAADRFSRSFHKHANVWLNRTRHSLSQLLILDTINCVSWRQLDLIYLQMKGYGQYSKASSGVLL